MSTEDSEEFYVLFCCNICHAQFSSKNTLKAHKEICQQKVSAQTQTGSGDEAQQKTTKYDSDMTSVDSQHSTTGSAKLPPDKDVDMETSPFKEEESTFGFKITNVCSMATEEKGIADDDDGEIDGFEMECEEIEEERNSDVDESDGEDYREQVPVEKVIIARQPAPPLALTVTKSSTSLLRQNLKTTSTKTITLNPTSLFSPPGRIQMKTLDVTTSSAGGNVSKMCTVINSAGVASLVPQSLIKTTQTKNKIPVVLTPTGPTKTVTSPSALSGNIKTVTVYPPGSGVIPQSTASGTAGVVAGQTTQIQSVMSNTNSNYKVINLSGLAGKPGQIVLLPGSAQTVLQGKTSATSAASSKPFSNVSVTTLPSSLASLFAPQGSPIMSVKSGSTLTPTIRTIPNTVPTVAPGVRMIRLSSPITSMQQTQICSGTSLANLTLPLTGGSQSSATNAVRLALPLQTVNQSQNPVQTLQINGQKVFVISSTVPVTPTVSTVPVNSSIQLTPSQTQIIQMNPPQNLLKTNTATSNNIVGVGTTPTGKPVPLILKPMPNGSGKTVMSPMLPITTSTILPPQPASTGPQKLVFIKNTGQILSVPLTMESGPKVKPTGQSLIAKAMSPSASKAKPAAGSVSSELYKTTSSLLTRVPLTGAGVALQSANQDKKILGQLGPISIAPGLVSPVISSVIVKQEPSEGHHVFKRGSKKPPLKKEKEDIVIHRIKDPEFRSSGSVRRSSRIQMKPQKSYIEDLGEEDEEEEEEEEEPEQKDVPAEEKEEENVYEDDQGVSQFLSKVVMVESNEDGKTELAVQEEEPENGSDLLAHEEDEPENGLSMAAYNEDGDEITESERISTENVLQEEEKEDPDGQDEESVDKSSSVTASKMANNKIPDDQGDDVINTIPKPEEINEKEGSVKEAVTSADVGSQIDEDMDTLSGRGDNGVKDTTVGTESQKSSVEQMDENEWLSDKKTSKYDPEYKPDSEASDSNYSDYSDVPSDHSDVEARRKRQKLAAAKGRGKPPLPEVKLEDHKDKFTAEDKTMPGGPERKLYSCKVCDHRYKCLTESIMAAHIAKHVYGQFTCPYCSFYSDGNSMELKNHIATVHTQEARLVCYVCGMTFVKRVRYRVHMSKIHGEKILKCKLCDKGFTHNKQLQKHLRKQHDGEGLYQCPTCSKCYFNEHFFQRHVNEGKCEKKHWLCQECGTILSSKLALSDHTKRIHRNIRNYMCEQCNYSCYRMQQLREHMHTHTGQHPYTCPLCDFSAAKNFQVTSHMRTHTGKKPYKCNKCNYASAWNVQLKTHRLAHLSLTMVECTICGIAFKDDRGLNLHKKKFHSRAVTGTEEDQNGDDIGNVGDPEDDENTMKGDNEDVTKQLCDDYLDEDQSASDPNPDNHTDNETEMKCGVKSPSDSSESDGNHDNQESSVKSLDDKKVPVTSDRTESARQELLDQNVMDSDANASDSSRAASPVLVSKSHQAPSLVSGISSNVHNVCDIAREPVRHASESGYQNFERDEHVPSCSPAYKEPPSLSREVPIVDDTYAKSFYDPAGNVPPYIMPELNAPQTLMGDLSPPILKPFADPIRGGAGPVNMPNPYQWPVPPREANLLPPMPFYRPVDAIATGHQFNPYDGQTKPLTVPHAVPGFRFPPHMGSMPPTEFNQYPAGHFRGPPAHGPRREDLPFGYEHSGQMYQDPYF